MKKKSFFNSSLFYRLLALAFSLLLVSYVNQDKLTRTINHNSNYAQTQLTSTKQDHVSMPLQLNVNNSKYFVTGYPDKVNVKLSGPAALVTTTVNTQNFRIYVDLTKLGIGRHHVQINQSGLNSALTYKVQPSYITVNIQPRKTQSFPIKVEYDHNNIAAGYSVGSPTTSDQSVKATGSLTDINKIHQIVAKLSLPDNTTSTVNYQTILEALDKNGKTVNVILTPSTTNVNLPITSGNNKKVPLKLVATNGDDGKKYTLTANRKNVKVFGSKKQLAAIKHVVVNVDVSDVKSTTTKDIKLDENTNNVSGFDNSQLKVKINVK